MGAINPDLVEDLRRVAEVRLDVPLSRHTTFGIGGPADVFVIAQNADDLRRLVALCHRFQESFFILGAGSNILVSDKGIRGVDHREPCARPRRPHGPTRMAGPSFAPSPAPASPPWPATFPARASPVSNGPAASPGLSAGPSSTTRAPTTAAWRRSSRASRWSARTAFSTSWLSMSSASATVRAPSRENSSRDT